MCPCHSVNDIFFDLYVFSSAPDIFGERRPSNIVVELILCQITKLLFFAFVTYFHEPLGFLESAIMIMIMLYTGKLNYHIERSKLAFAISENAFFA